MKKKTPLNITVSEEARRLLAIHANRAGCSVSSLIERMIREEEERWQENLRRIAASTHMIQLK